MKTDAKLANEAWEALFRAQATIAQEFAAASADNRIIVRPYGDDGVRVTVASAQENDAFLEFAQRWRASAARA